MRPLKLFYNMEVSPYLGFRKVPTKFSVVLGCACLLIAATALSCSITFGIMAPRGVTETQASLLAISPQVGIIALITGVLFCKFGEIGALLTERRNGKLERKLKEMKKNCDQMEIQFHYDCYKALSRDLFESSSRSEYALSLHIGNIMKCLSFEQSKKSIPTFKHGSAENYIATHVRIKEESAEYVEELADLARIWSSKFAVGGARLSLNDNVRVNEVLEGIKNLGKNLGIDESVASYYKGVPIDDICA